MKQLLLFFFTLFLTGYGYVSHAQNLSWVATKGPYSTTVNTFDTAHGAIFAGTKTGLFESTNGGNLWFAVPSVSGIVYDIATIGTNIYTGGVGITLSTDSGVTWVVRDSGLPQFPLVYALRNLHDTLYACMGGQGFFRSLDAGKYWAQPSPDIANKTINTMIATGTSLILAEGAGILRSSNNGFSWTEPNGVIADQAVHVFAMKDHVIFAGTEAGVYRSIDDGVTWTESRVGMRADDIVTSLVVSGDDKTIFAGTKDVNSEVGIYRSQDDGNSWQLVNNGLSNLSISSLFTTGTEIFVGTALGISRSDNNGDSWQTISEGLPKPVVTALGSIYNIAIAGTAGSYSFSSDDAGDHWMQHRKGLTQKNLNTILTFGTTVFAGTDAFPKQGIGGVHRSTDNGITWIQTNTGMPIMSITSLASYGTKIFACGDSGIFSSSDNGNSWKPSSSLFIPKVLYSDDASLYAGMKSAIWIFTDNAGWEQTTFSQNQNIHAITKKGKYLYAGTDSGVYRDSQSVWKLITGDTLAVLSLWSNSIIIVAGTKTGMYVSSDDGITWQFQQSAGVIPVNAFCTTNRNLYAGTSSGVIKAPLAQFGVKIFSVGNALSLNVTNPSSGHAIIHYRIDERSNTSVMAYDLLGKECARILNDERDPGEYNLEWNTSSLASGAYILRLVSGGKQASSMINVVH